MKEDITTITDDDARLKRKAEELVGHFSHM
jgi:hypothetical protein